MNPNLYVGEGLKFQIDFLWYVCLGFLFFFFCFDKSYKNIVDTISSQSKEIH